MDTTQFAMIEELASLIKDNLYSKHLVLSTEEALVTLLQQHYQDDDDEHDRSAHHGTTGNNTIELQPTSSYNRLLLHRLADIFGFAHESVGEGDDRHLVLQRCPETAIPPVLISDVLWKYDDGNGPSASVVLTRNETDQKIYEAQDVQDAISFESLHLKTDTGKRVGLENKEPENPVPSDVKPLQHPVPLSAASLKEREAAYRAARERIFATHEAKEKDTSAAKSRHVPAVAQRMIAHALGKRVEDPKERTAMVKNKGKELVNGRNIRTSSTNNLCADRPGSRGENRAGRCNSSSLDGNLYRSPSAQSRQTSSVSAETLKKEQTGAAKRMFAHALRLPGVEASDGAARRSK